MNRNVLETVMGALVLAVAFIFLAFAYSSAGIRTVSGYEVTAKFDHIDGIRVGTDVRIGGVKVGAVTATALDPRTFEAEVRMSIDRAYTLPVDTIAVIGSSSLLGDNIMTLMPGNEDKIIPPGGAIRNTQPPISLTSMLGQLFYSFTGGSKSSDGASPTPSDPLGKKP
jgi:phospholipid/cholesterol/gamma-HCH transport system substrate-binding protein